ncbi:unnamed protein product [Acanthoscelides obtectus]|uniref:Uncharacterized protein n=1 Tax=Acanthoscelides obtectus TaxID=200917 RepID=A0A9P0KRC8_ACAOB|nr:unnamed protein product [Acanthoscelides obtectus]CAK1652633.1 hypothetical protein AOBTE_LOCUS17874 [Acanthoscelides obtectus]
MFSTWYKAQDISAGPYQVVVIIFVVISAETLFQFQSFLHYSQVCLLALSMTKVGTAPCSNRSFCRYGYHLTIKWLWLITLFNCSSSTKYKENASYIAQLLYGATLLRQLDRVLGLQRRAVRLMVEVKYTDNCKHVFIEWELLTVSSLFVYDDRRRSIRNLRRCSRIRQLK